MQAFLPVVFTAGNDIKKQDKGSEDRNADPLNFRRSFQRVYCFNIVYSISECVFARDRCFPVTPRSGCDRNTCNGISANICTGDPAQLPCLCRISCVRLYERNQKCGSSLQFFLHKSGMDLHLIITGGL